MNTADDAYAFSFAAAENAWTGSAAAAETAYATDLTLADKDLVEDLGIADGAYVTALGSLDVANVTSVATAEADYQVAVASGKAADTAAWAVGVGTPEADFQAAYAQAEADWLTGVGPDYVTFATAYAQAEADYDLALTSRLADLDVEFAGHFVTFAGAAAAEAGTHWANRTAGWLSYEQARIGRENTLLSAYSTSDRTYGISAAQGARQHAIDTAAAEKNYDVATYQSDPAAETTRDSALADAQQAYDTALADATVAWTTGVAGAETTFLTGEATGYNNFLTALAGFDKTYTIGLAGDASAADNDDAASLGDYWNHVETAKSARFTAQSTAWADFRLASYADQATAVATMAATLDTPWAYFQADLSAAKRDWWTSTRPDYLAWVTNTNLSHETYQAAAGTQYVALVTAATTADVAYVTSMAGGRETRAIAEATAQESYVLSVAPARETYLVAMSQAGRDLAAGGTQTDYDTASGSAAGTYRTTTATASGDRRVDLAQAGKDYIDALYGPTGSALTWEADRASATKTFTIGEANAYADMLVDLAILDRDYGILEAQTYADALATLSTTTTNTTPWAQLAAAETSAESARITSLLTEEAILEIAQANATRDFEIAEATAAETLATAQSATTAAQNIARSNASFTWAQQQSQAEADAAASGAFPGVGTPVELVVPEGFTERMIGNMVGEWGVGMMANSPPEEWAESVERYIRSFNFFGASLPEDVTAELRAWIGAEQARRMQIDKWVEQLSNLDPGSGDCPHHNPLLYNLAAFAQGFADFGQGATNVFITLTNVGVFFEGAVVEVLNFPLEVSGESFRIPGPSYVERWDWARGLFFPDEPELNHQLCVMASEMIIIGRVAGVPGRPAAPITSELARDAPKGVAGELAEGAATRIKIQGDRVYALQPSNGGSGPLRWTRMNRRTSASTHGNCLANTAETHVYVIRQPQGWAYRIGESVQGVRLSDGASLRAEQQVRELIRKYGPGFTSEIRGTFPGKAAGRAYETRLIERFRHMFGDDTLPGNLTNR